MGSTSGNVEVEVDGLYRTGGQIAGRAEPAHAAGRGLVEGIEGFSSGHPEVRSAMSGYSGEQVGDHVRQIHPAVVAGGHRVGNVAAVARDSDERGARALQGVVGGTSDLADRISGRRSHWDRGGYGAAASMTGGPSGGGGGGSGGGPARGQGILPALGHGHHQHREDGAREHEHPEGPQPQVRDTERLHPSAQEASSPGPQPTLAVTVQRVAHDRVRSGSGPAPQLRDTEDSRPDGTQVDESAHAGGETEGESTSPAGQGSAEGPHVDFIDGIDSGA